MASRRVTAELGRFHLFGSWACPMTHRALIARELKGLRDCISFSTVDVVQGERGWQFSKQYPNPLHPEHTTLREVYTLDDEDFAGRVLIPVLFDKHTNRVVSNSSEDIVRMLNSDFNAFCATLEQAALDLYPEPLRHSIDAVNDWVHSTLNEGVYSAGLASSQQDYETAEAKVVDSLHRLEAILGKQRYLVGDGKRLTEADVRLLPTLVRFDAVYVNLFKVNRVMVRDLPHLSNYARDLCQMGAVADTVDMDFTKRSYYASFTRVSSPLVPAGPVVDFTLPHDRADKFPL